MAITPELRLLRYFVAVAEELHFGRAAARLQIAQPSLSRAIRDLERMLGTDLFTRTKRSVRLTDAGRALLADGPRALAEVERAFEHARSVGHGEVGELRLGFLPSAALELVPAVVRASREAHPGVRFRLLELLDEPQLEALREGAVDVGLLRTPRPSSELAFEPLLSERLSLVVAPDHRLASRSRVRYADLRNEGLLIWPRAEAAETYDAIIEACRRAGFSPRLVQEASSPLTLLGLVAAGIGVGVAASAYRAHTVTDVVFIPITDSEATLYLAWRPRDPSVARDNLLSITRRVATGQTATRPQGRDHIAPTAPRRRRNSIPDHEPDG
jgi:DNA-binding transcriptional LysR family regulator